MYKMKKKGTRSNSKLFKAAKDGPLEALPTIDKFQHTKLPLLKEVIALIYHKVDSGMSFDSAITDVSQLVQDHWIARNIYTISHQATSKRLASHMKEYRYLCRVDSSKQGDTFLERCNAMNNSLNALFDVFCIDEKRRKKLEETHGIPMMKQEYDFLENMRKNRGYTCEKVDVSFHRQQTEKKRKMEKQLKNQSSSFETVSLLDNENEDNEISMGTDQDFVSDDENSEPVTRRKSRFVDTSTPHRSISTRSSSKVTDEEYSINTSPVHVRTSKNMVLSDIYHACAELDGEGFSLREMQIALKVIGNRIFKTRWTVPEEKDRGSKYDDDDTLICDTMIDSDTLPTRSAIRKKLKQIHAYSLSLIADRIGKANEDGDIITHATDSTTRKQVGTFAPSGLHINREEYLPLPTLTVTSETTQNIAEGIKSTFEMLEAASKFTAKELYEKVDAHMTDSTAHNKGIATGTSKLLDREVPPGQLFCTTHTTLGFDRGIESVINKIEIDMGMDNLFKGFLLDISINRNSETLSLTFLTWVLNLFGPSFIQKPWNYHKDFQTFMKRQGKDIYLFEFKDSRFESLSKSSAITCHHWADFIAFLDQNDFITNKLACLVRDAMQFDYIIIVLVVVASFGIHLISPYFYKTIGKATHSELQEFFTKTHSSLLTDAIDEGFFLLDKPIVDGVSQNVMDETINTEYGDEVVKSIRSISADKMEECIILANILRPKLAKVLENQRGEFYGFGTKKDSSYYVFDQVFGVDKTVTNNIELERQCSSHCNRLQKKPNVSTVSRGNILKSTTHLRDNEQENSKTFRKMGGIVKELDSIEAQWKAKQEDLRQVGLSKKEQQALHLAQRRNIILASLKAEGGPFTSDDEVDAYLRDEQDPEKAKKRLRDEITYFRDTCTSLPRNCNLFKIMTVDKSTRKRRVMTADEFANNLKVLLGKASERSTISLTDFHAAIWHYNQ